MTSNTEQTQAQREAAQDLKSEIRFTQRALGDLLAAWNTYQDEFNADPPVEGYPFSESLEEVAYAAAGMTFNDTASTTN